MKFMINFLSIHRMLETQSEKINILEMSQYLNVKQKVRIINASSKQRLLLQKLTKLKRKV